MRLTTHFRVVLKLRMSGAKHLRLHDVYRNKLNSLRTYINIYTVCVCVCMLTLGKVNFGIMPIKILKFQPLTDCMKRRCAARPAHYYRKIHAVSRLQYNRNLSMSQYQQSNLYFILRFLSIPSFFSLLYTKFWLVLGPAAIVAASVCGWKFPKQEQTWYCRAMQYPEFRRERHGKVVQSGGSLN